MDHKARVQKIMDAMSQGRVAPLFDAMAEDVTWRWMGVGQRSRAFDGKQLIIDTLFGGNAETLGPSSSVEVRCMHADADCVVVEHSGRNELPGMAAATTTTTAGSFDSRTAPFRKFREYMDTQLVTETFGADGDS